MPETSFNYGKVHYADFLLNEGYEPDLLFHSVQRLKGHLPRSVSVTVYTHQGERLVKPVDMPVEKFMGLFNEAAEDYFRIEFRLGDATLELGRRQDITPDSREFARLSYLFEDRANFARLFNAMETVLVTNNSRPDSDRFYAVRLHDPYSKQEPTVTLPLFEAEKRLQLR